LTQNSNMQTTSPGPNLASGTGQVNQLTTLTIKGRVQCFSLQVVMNKCFLLNLEKNWCRSVLTFSRKPHT